jgi:hypothetical protein
MERGDQKGKGGDRMNIPYVFANGLVLGAILMAFIIFMGRK